MNKNKLLKFLDIKKFKNQTFKHNKVSYSIQTHKNFNKILKEKSKTIFAVLGGNIVDGKEKLLKYGDTVTASILKNFLVFIR